MCKLKLVGKKFQNSKKSHKGVPILTQSLEKLQKIKNVKNISKSIKKFFTKSKKIKFFDSFLKNFPKKVDWDELNMLSQVKD